MFVMNLDLIGEFLYHGAIDVKDLVAGSSQAHDDSAYDFNEDEMEEFYCSGTLL